MSETSSTAIVAEDHFKLRLPGDPQIAPDGRHVAFVRNRADVETDGWVSEVAAVDTASGTQVELGRGAHPRWALAFGCRSGMRACGPFRTMIWRPLCGEQKRQRLLPS